MRASGGSLSSGAPYPVTNGWSILLRHRKGKRLYCSAGRLNREFTYISTIVNNITSKRAAVSFGERRLLSQVPGI
jgi:hypothetical protein